MKGSAFGELSVGESRSSGGLGIAAVRENLSPSCSDLADRPTTEAGAPPAAVIRKAARKNRQMRNMMG